MPTALETFSELVARAGEALGNPSRSADEGALDDAWMGVLALWDVAPESFEGRALPLGPILRGALWGCADALARGGANPMDELDWASESSKSGAWTLLSRRIASPRGMSPADPFHRARVAASLAPGGLGLRGSTIDDNGFFSQELATLLIRLHPGTLIHAVPALAARLQAERIAEAAAPAKKKRSRPASI